MAHRDSLHSIAPPPGVKRSARRYLLYPAFQLKYTAYLVVVVLSVMVALGAVIWRTASASAASAQFAAAQAERALKESQTSSHVVHMQSVSAAGSDSGLVKMLEDELKKTDRAAVDNLAEVKRRSDEVARDTQRLFYILLGAGTGLLAILVGMGIFITHRIVGPVFKLKRLLRRIASGRLVVKERLRRGDELGDLFDTLFQMTLSLKVLQLEHLATLGAAMEAAEAGAGSEVVLQKLRELETQIRMTLAGHADAAPKRIS
jgi:nitrogen fixation/metabolism regulation signal transduction histidine kinase